MRCASIVVLQGGLADWSEIGMVHRLLRGETFLCINVSFEKIRDGDVAYLMIVSKKLIEEVDRIIANKSLVVTVDERMPRLLWLSRKNVIVLRIELNVVFVQIVKELLGP